MEAHQLRAEDEAVAAERDHVGLRLPPALQRRGPFLRAPEVEHRLARLDDGAVDDPRRDRRDLAGDHRGHRLIEEGDATSSLHHGDQRLPATEPAHRPEVRVIEPLGDGGDLLEDRERVGRAPGHQGLERLRDQQEPGLDPVIAGLLHEPRAAGKPAASLGHLAPLDAFHPQPVGGADRQADVARSDGLEMGSRCRPP